MDKELQAMGKIFKILSALDDGSRARVWKWVDEKLCETESGLQISAHAEPQAPATLQS